MIKQFTTVVPDRLYFPEISGDTTASFTYDGPDVLSVVVQKGSGAILNPRYNPDTDPLYPNIEQVITVDANTAPNIAYLLRDNPITGNQYQFETKVLKDGSTYEARVNPSLHDYFTITRYNFDNEQFELSVLHRRWKTRNLIQAELIKATLEVGFLDKIEIDNGGDQAVKDFVESKGTPVTNTAEEVVQIIREYISALESYIEEESEIVVWEYSDQENIPSADIPELPDFLKNFF